MPAPVQALGTIPQLAAPEAIRHAGIASQPGAFQSVLANAVDHVEGLKTTADAAVQRFLTGENEELHQVVIATQQAELSFELFQQVRNKVVQAYQEVMRMQM